MSTERLPVPADVSAEARELTQVANELFRGVGELTISTQDEFEMAGEFVKKIARTRRDVEAAKKARRDPYTSLLNAISGEYERPLEILRTAEANLDGGLKRWIAAERKRQDELNRQREEARRLEIQRALKAEEDARRAAMEAHSTHQAAVVEADPDLHETAADLAAVAEAKSAEAAQHAETAVELAAPVQSYQPVKGIHTREVWRARVTDVALVPREHMIPDEAKLDRLAKAIKAPSHIPGVEFYAETTVIKTTR